MNQNQSRLTILDALRAIAAISVCLYHFNGKGDSDPVGRSSISFLLQHGNYGVEIFFVISGFIIPTAMFWSKFTYRDTGNFLLRRWTRLYPAFAFVAIWQLIFSHTGNAALGYGGDSPGLTWARAITNFTLTSEFFGHGWYLAIFWTLAVEAQYYLLVALSFPLLVHRREWVRMATVFAWIGATYVAGYGPSVFTWTAFFSLGILVFLKKQQLVRSWLFWVLLVLAAISHESSRNEISACIGFATAVLILYSPAIKSRILIGLGAISYSVYLTHLIIGGAVLIHWKRLPAWLQIGDLSIAAATLVTVAVSVGFYFCLEKPFHNLARRMKPKRERRETP